YKIYVQRIHAAGYPVWTTNGVLIGSGSDHQKNPQLCSDDNKGAIITWWDDDIFAQRINAMGEIQWTPNGVSICTAASRQSFPQICSDGNGGAIIAWQDKRTGYYDIYAQRINSSGDPQWTANGTAICTASDYQRYVDICSDMNGGAIIAWQDESVFGNYDIYIQRINSTGNFQWTLNGIAVCNVNGNQQDVKVCSDGTGGTFVTWIDNRSALTPQIYIQRIDASGTPHAIVNGTQLSDPNSHKDCSNHQICSNAAGTAVVVWESWVEEWNQNIYAAAIDSSG
ncbi:unnamed protein product, partial [marine sediment metagenome]